MIDLMSINLLKMNLFQIFRHIFSNDFIRLYLNLFLFSVFIFTITSMVIVPLIRNVEKTIFIFNDFLHFILPFTKV